MKSAPKDIVLQELGRQKWLMSAHHHHPYQHRVAAAVLRCFVLNWMS